MCVLFIDCVTAEVLHINDQVRIYVLAKTYPSLPFSILFYIIISVSNGVTQFYNITCLKELYRQFTNF